MARPKTSGPTDRELMILRILWEGGPMTVREVHGALGEEVRVGYTSVGKIMQIMHDKGLVTRDETPYSHVYGAVRGQEETQTEIVGNLMNRVFGGSAMNLVARALAAKPASEGELQEIKELIERLEQGGRHES